MLMFHQNGIVNNKEQVTYFSWGHGFDTLSGNGMTINKWENACKRNDIIKIRSLENYTSY